MRFWRPMDPNPTQDVEQLLIAGLGRYLWPVNLVLLIPVDIPQFKEWVSVVERLPQRFKILLRVSNHHALAICLLKARSRAAA